MDPYVYPGTSVLKNLRDLRDQDRLSKFEMNMTTRRVMELLEKPVSGGFDARHVRAIHRYIFQDVYPWAGEFRTVDISRSGQFPFAFSQHIESSLDTLFGKLAKEQHLAGLAQPAFCNRAAYYMGELNAIHPFRDGNGRTQREFIRQLARRNGSAIQWSRITREQMTAASILSFQRADNSGLESVIAQALDPDARLREPSSPRPPA